MGNEHELREKAFCPVCGREYITGYSGRWCDCPRSIPKEVVQAYLTLYYKIDEIERTRFKNPSMRRSNALLRQWKARKYKRPSTVFKKLAKISYHHVHSQQYQILHPYRYVHAVINRYSDPAEERYGEPREGHIPESWAYKVLVYCLVWDHRMAYRKPRYKDVMNILEEYGVQDHRDAKAVQKIYEKTSLHDVMMIIEELLCHDLFRPRDAIPPPRSMLSWIHELIDKPHLRSVTVNSRPR